MAYTADMKIVKQTEIENLRIKAGMSRELLADKLGVSATTIYRWEKGSRRPARIYLKEISRILRTSL